MAATPRREPFTMLIAGWTPRPSEESDFGLLRMYASVSTKSTSAVGTERVPILSLTRLMRMLLGVPSARGVGTRERARPRRPGAAPPGRAGGAGHAGCGLAEEVCEGAGEDGGHVLALRLQGVGALLPDVALGVDRAGVVGDGRRLVAPGVVALQLRRGGGGGP